MDLQLLDVLCITETHLKKEDVTAASDFWNDTDGSVYRFDRDRSRGGGVMLIISNKYQHKLIDVPNCGIEAVVAEILCPIKVYVVGIYIPPHQNKVLAVDGIGRILTQLGHNDEARIIVMGDFNEDLLEIRRNTIYDYLTGQSFNQHVTEPTTDYRSLLDHIYTKNVDQIVVNVQDCYFSDHDKTFCFVHTS